MSFGFSVGDFLAAIQLAHKIQKEFADAPSQFKAISDEVRNLSIVLQDADVAFPNRELSNDQKRDLEDIDKGCRNILDELQRILDKNSELSSESGSVGKRIKRVWKRLNWKPEDIDEFRSRISINIGFLTAFNGRLTRDNVVKLVWHQENQEWQAILNWLTPIDFVSQQHDFITRRQEGTGQWLLDSAEFKAWVETDKQTLFCPGIPGGGKTILTSIVVDNLYKRFRGDNTIGIVYIYCNFRRQDEQKADSLLASLLRQLGQERPPLADSVKTLYNCHKDKRTRPLFDEISGVLQSVAAAYSRVFIIVDALDECKSSDGCRSRFLSEIFSLQAKCGVNFFATSRFIPEVTEKFAGNPSLEIRGSNDDVRKYLGTRISQGESRILRRSDLRAEVTTEIVKAIDGMFLLAELHLESLLDMKLPKDIRTALKNLPKGSGAYDRAYQEAMDRVERQGPKSVQFAKEILSWITCAKRPLATCELQHALAVEIGESYIDEDNLPQVEDMVSVCAGLVTADEESGIIRLVHYTTQEYFERTQKQWFPNAEANIMRICVTYLSFNTFKDDAFAILTETSDEKELKSFSKYPLLPYAAQYWGYHACRGPESKVIDLIIDFLEQESKLACFLMHTLTYQYGASGRRTVADVPKLQIAACFSLKETVKTLLEGGADVEARSSDGWTALSSAAWNGQEAMIELLLEHGADIEAKTENGWTALANACRNEHLGVVRKLLAKGANIETKDNKGWTPMNTAAFHEHDSVISFLLDQGVNIDAKCGGGWTALMTAAFHKRESVIHLLLNRGANIEAKNSTGWTSLDQVAYKGDDVLTKLLLENGASFDTKSKDGCTPLMKAAKSGNERTVQLLLQAGTDKDTRDTRGETAYDKAAHRGKTAIMHLLS